MVDSRKLYCRPIQFLLLKITLTTPAAAALNKNESNVEDEDEDEGEEDDNMYSDDNASMINQDDTKPYNFIITNDGGYFEAITNLLSGDQIFELYQHLVLDPTHNNTQNWNLSRIWI